MVRGRKGPGSVSLVSANISGTSACVNSRKTWFGSTGGGASKSIWYISPLSRMDQPSGGTGGQSRNRAATSPESSSASAWYSAADWSFIAPKGATSLGKLLARLLPCARQDCSVERAYQIGLSSRRIS